MEQPFAEVTVDLEAQEVRAEGILATFRIDPFARRCLLDGTDELGFLLGHAPAIAAHEQDRRSREDA